MNIDKKLEKLIGKEFYKKDILNVNSGRYIEPKIPKTLEEVKKLLKNGYFSIG